MAASPPSSKAPAIPAAALPRSIEPVKKLAVELSQTQFADRFVHPFLVLARTKSIETVVQTANKATFTGEGTAVAALDVVEHALAYVSPIEKRVKTKSRTSTGLGQPVTLGRTTSNDMVIPVASVSSEHFEFVPPADGRGAWLARDRGSKNGSFIDGVRMIPGQLYDLANGSFLELGRDVAGWFFAADALWPLLRDSSRLAAMLQQRKRTVVEDW